MLARIRDIRASEKRFYQKVRDLFALSSDYQGREKDTNLFFAEVQNKLLFAATRHTAAELIETLRQVPGVEMTFSGKAGANQELRTMHARLVARGRRVYQAAIIGSKNPAPEQIDQFFQSFKLE